MIPKHQHSSVFIIQINMCANAEFNVCVIPKRQSFLSDNTLLLNKIIFQITTEQKRQVLKLVEKGGGFLGWNKKFL